MNFILDIIGKAGSLHIRPNEPQRAQIQAARLVGHNRLNEAVRIYETFGESHILPCGHLYLLLNQHRRALAAFEHGVATLIENNEIENLIERAHRSFTTTAFSHAIHDLEHARRLVDTGLTAASGISVAGGAPDPAIIAGFLRLSGLLLKGLARAHLARELALTLPNKSTTQCLSWMTSERAVEDLLHREVGELTAAARAMPANPELWYRLGLVASTVNKPDLTREAFQNVLRTHPHHAGSAVRLGDKASLRAAFHFSPKDLAAYLALAESAHDKPRFDQAVRAISINHNATTIKANLAFALAQMNLLDATRSQWREARRIGEAV